MSIASITNAVPMKIECRYKIMCGIVCAKEFDNLDDAKLFMHEIIDSHQCEINDVDKSIGAFIVIQQSGFKRKIIKPDPTDYAYLWEDDDFVPDMLDDIF